MSRYIERAEDLTRLLAVTFHSLLDAGNTDSEPEWRPVVAMMHEEELFQKDYKEYSASNVIDFMLWNGANPNALVWCMTMARENARSVRDQISKEMWEYLNRLYFRVKETNKASVAPALLEFFAQLRDGCQAFQGITNETMTHSEAYQFIQLGKHLERAEKTVRIVDIKYQQVSRLPEGSPDEALQLMTMLKSCSAFEPFRKEHASNMNAGVVVEYLLLNKDFPRAVSYCLNRCLQAVNIISTGMDVNRLSGPQRSFGRLVSELEYLDVHEILGEPLHSYLEKFLIRMNQSGEEVTRTFFSTQVILPELHPQQAQQQQQQ